MSVIKEYFKAQSDLEKKWGEDSVVLMQIGSFYEVYSVPGKGKAEKVSGILGMQLALKNGKSKGYSNDNPYMVGFPDYALSNHLSKLLKSGLIVGIYDQFSVTGSSKKGRELVKVYSPSTYIESDSSETNNLLVLKTSEWKCVITGETLQSLHWVCIDYATGTIYYNEVYDSQLNKVAESELYQTLQSYTPTEIVVVTPNYLNLECDTKVYYKELNNEYSKPSYQNSVFEKVFGGESGLTRLESLKLAQFPAIAEILVTGLVYAWEFDKNITKNLKTPIRVEAQTSLILNRDSIKQLHITSTEQKHSLLGLFSGLTKTQMGKRLLQHRLLHPFTNPETIENCYSQNLKLVGDYKWFGSQLLLIPDLEKYYRLMVLGRLQPYLLAEMKESLLICIELLKKGKELLGTKRSKLKPFLAELTETFDFSVLRTSKLQSITSSYFLPGINETIDSIEHETSNTKNCLHRFADSLSGLIEENSSLVKVCYTERDSWHFQTTKTRWSKLPKKFTVEFEKNLFTHDQFEVQTNKSGVKITSRFIRGLSAKYKRLKESLLEAVKEEYTNKLRYWAEVYGESILTSSELIAQIDVGCAAAKSMKEWGYCRPVVKNGESADFSAKDLRHPLLERILDTEYIPNDVELGGESPRGNLIYGENSCGKSSLLRAIGENIVLAQAGLFVAASSFSFTPFTRLISKISSVDDQFSGKSTFITELTEIQDALTLADSRSLVLADELCCSTESYSAHALVAAVLEHLIAAKSCFAFATHLHDLLSFKTINDSEEIQILHFQTTTTPENNKIVFNRKLQQGRMNGYYGLEIAKVWGVDPAFMKRAFELRGVLTGETELVSTKKSRYNSKVYMDQCKMCGSKKDLHTHHIYEQQFADSEGLIGNRFHKNKQFNLLVLCSECHKKIHS